MLFPLVGLDGQGPRSHQSAHVADTEALELVFLLLWMCNLQELCALVILWGTARSREAGIDSSGRKRLPRL